MERSVKTSLLPWQFSMVAVREDVFRSTPPEVWREYFADGYTYAEAIDEELSYAE